MMTGSTEDGAREFAASGRTTAGTGTWRTESDG